MKDLGDRSRSILGLSQRSHINTVLVRFFIKDRKPGDTLVAKGDKFSLKQCPTMDLEKEGMHKVPYVSAVGSLMYAQFFTHSNLAFIVGVLGIYLANLGKQH
ncbi:unnamed protein product [Lathyrus sativus]|nr:unnamed protein product [Lathyrus sativus]